MQPKSKCHIDWPLNYLVGYLYQRNRQVFVKKWLSQKRPRKLLRCLVALIFLTAISFPFISNASLILKCQNILSAIKGEPQKYAEGQVEVIFYPAKYHMEIAVSGEMYNPADGFTSVPLELAKRAARSKKSAIVAFQLRVTEKELEEISAFVRQDSKNHQSCVSGVCTAINKITGMTVPFPVNYFPSYTALYLALRKMTGTSFGRIQKIEFVGNTGQFIAGIPMSLASDFLFSSVLYYVTLETTLGIVYYVIPTILR